MYEAVQHAIERAHINNCKDCGSAIHGLADVAAKVQALYMEAIKFG